MSEDVHAKIAEVVAAHPVVLFMKGSRRFPQCGFSSRVVSMLDQFLPRYETVNVLSDPALRDGIKAFSQWPTIPQLYVRGKFVGGCDIVTEMHESGELATLLGDLATGPAAAKGAPTPTKAPTITLTKGAAEAFKSAAESDAEHPRITIDAQFKYDLYFDTKQADDLVVSSEGLTLFIDPESARRADGLRIDFVVGADGSGGGFKLDNPNEPPRVRSLSPEELAAMRKRGDKITLYDVRTRGERATAKLPDDVFLEDETVEKALLLPKDTPIAFYCHHGHRSRAAANHFVSSGFTRIYNLEGGIDAWSLSIDSTVPRY